MGLDMYLNRTKKIPGLLPDDYMSIENLVSRFDSIPQTLDLDKLTGINGANILVPCIVDRGVTHTFTWYSIFEEVGYWRKSNQIHKWFVDNVQGGEDDCLLYEVTQEHLESLLDNINQVLLSAHVNSEDLVDAYNSNVIKFSIDLAQTLLPTNAGFFFGDTGYGEYYVSDLNKTVKIIKEALTTNFEEQILFYRSSW